MHSPWERPVGRKDERISSDMSASEFQKTRIHWSAPGLDDAVDLVRATPAERRSQFARGISKAGTRLDPRRPAPW